MKKIIIGIVTLSLLISGCAVSRDFYIVSDLPARIEVEGRHTCDSTPCRVPSWYKANEFNECIRGKDNRIAAYPLKEGYRQYKLVKSECTNDKNAPPIKVYFDMKTKPTMQIIQK